MAGTFSSECVQSVKHTGLALGSIVDLDGGHKAYVRVPQTGGELSSKAGVLICTGAGQAA